MHAGPGLQGVETLLWAAWVVRAVHLAFGAFIFLGWLAIILGRLAGAGFGRNRLLRAVHLGGIIAVTAFAATGRYCPLTDLEFWMLERGGGPVFAREPFLARLIAAALYPAVPPGLLLALTLLMAVTTIAFWWLIPPDRYRD